ncbi:hypothetical protein [Rubripirellula reticaptiva]|uniref:Uncharacterized protein n=1 Tax=Rubripirellula reticaptiva TaxID=2528013 RepID=A0A5C6EQC8_9BACT|nr:hypothetical protein [Rubripirellula reticaptiva]TWU49771.1 hypothetical protein Poly59_43960 [Rubripirellula reticaptiva]
MSNPKGPFETNPFGIPTPDGRNPYAPTSHVSLDEVDLSDVEQYRRKYLSHEASIKSMGFIYLLGALFTTPVGLLAMAGSFSIRNDPEGMIVMAIVGSIYTGIGLLHGFVGYGFRKLKSWARIAGMVTSTMGLIIIPIGTMISAYVLYLLISKKGKVVFSDEYRSVIDQTPHIKYKTSIVVWILLGLIAVFVILAFVGAFLGV